MPWCCTATLSFDVIHLYSSFSNNALLECKTLIAQRKHWKKMLLTAKISLSDLMLHNESATSTWLCTMFFVDLNWWLVGITLTLNNGLWLSNLIFVSYYTDCGVNSWNIKPFSVINDEFRKTYMCFICQNSTVLYKHCQNILMSSNKYCLHNKWLPFWQIFYFGVKWLCMAIECR